MNGKWFPGKDNAFRIGCINFKWKDIKLTDRQPHRTTGERCRTIRMKEKRHTGNRKKGLRPITAMMVRNAKQLKEKETTRTGKNTQKRCKVRQGWKRQKTAKGQVNEELGKRIFQTGALQRKASVMV